MDVDGTLTDGRIYIGAQGEVMKAFDVRDGYAIVHILPQLGITPAIITGRSFSFIAYFSSSSPTTGSIDICLKPKSAK